MAMARRAFGGISGIEVCDIEMARGGPTYSIDTVMQLERPGTETMLVMGASTAAGLSTWHRAEELAQRVTIAVIQPTGTPHVHLDGWRTAAVFMEPVEASATRVRRLLAGPRRPETAVILDRLVPAAVMGYIADHRLYSA